MIGGRQPPAPGGRGGSQNMATKMASPPFVIALLLALTASATVAAAVIASECGNGNACAAEHTCTSSAPNAGRAFGCAPHVNATVCADRRFSCPASTECGVCPKKLVTVCSDRVTGASIAASENIAARPVHSDSKALSVCSVISGTVFDSLLIYCPHCILLWHRYE
jgi:hypothetical protein